jgi:hypothetical protein
MNENFRIAKWAGEGWGLIGPQHTILESEILAAEARLGFRLPEALQHWYRWAGKYTPFRHYEDKMVPLDMLQVYAGHLIFMWEREGSHFYGIPQSHLNEPDPLFWWQHSGAVPELPWEDTCLHDDEGCRVSQWLTDKILDDIALKMAGVTLSEEKFGRLEAHYRLLRTNLSASTMGLEGSFFSDDDTLIFCTPGSRTVAITTKSLSAAQRFCERMGIDTAPESLVVSPA